MSNQSRSSRMPRLVALVVLALVSAACHRGGSTATGTTESSGSSTSSSTASPTTVKPSASTTRPTAPPATTAPTTPPPTAPCGPDQEADTSFASGAGSATLLLTAVTVRHTARCTDTVVFGFAGAAQAPGVHVSLANPPFTLAGSGATVAVRGDRFYKVQFEPASTFDLGTGRPSYTGPTNITPPGTAHLRQLVETDSFEGVVTWIIGVGAGDQFLPSVAASPPSLTLTF